MMTLKNEMNREEFMVYNNIDMKFVTEILTGIRDEVKAIEENNITVTIPKNPDLSIPMWLCTDKNGTTRIIRCSDKPLRNIVSWHPGNNDYIEASIDSPFSARFFGIFWKKAAEELKKMGLPKWEDDPVEIEVSRIKINYY